jgi:hypothetical protein
MKWTLSIKKSLTKNCKCIARRTEAWSATVEKHVQLCYFYADEKNIFDRVFIDFAGIGYGRR